MTRGQRPESDTFHPESFHTEWAIVAEEGHDQAHPVGYPVGMNLLEVLPQQLQNCRASYGAERKQF
jgi:hypothetical protein